MSFPKLLLSFVLVLLWGQTSPIFAQIVVHEAVCRLETYQPDRDLNVRYVPSAVLTIRTQTVHGIESFWLESLQELVPDERIFVTIRNEGRVVAEGFLPAKGTALTGSGTYEIYSTAMVRTKTRPATYVAGAGSYAGPLFLTVGSRPAQRGGIHLDPVEGQITYAFSPNVHAAAGEKAVRIDDNFAPGLPGPRAEGTIRLRAQDSACYHCVPSASCSLENLTLPVKVKFEGGSQYPTPLGVSVERLIPTELGDFLFLWGYITLVDYRP